MGTFELALPEETILQEIADKRMKQLDIAQTYALIMRQAGANGVDWGRINKAIIDRWSRSGLVRIKNMAHSGKCWT